MTAGDIRQNFLTAPLSGNARVVHVFGKECIGPDFIDLYNSGWAATTWTANLTVYTPLFTVEPLIVAQFFWMAGGAAAGSTDVGIYDRPGTTLLAHAGAVSNTATSDIQLADITDYELPPGRYWLALTCNSGTQQYRRSNANVGALDFVQIRQHASDYSSGLPATATLNAPTVAILPEYGFTGYTV